MSNATEFKGFGLPSADEQSIDFGDDDLRIEVSDLDDPQAANLKGPPMTARDENPGITEVKDSSTDWKSTDGKDARGADKGPPAPAPPRVPSVTASGGGADPTPSVGASSVDRAKADLATDAQRSLVELLFELNGGDAYDYEAAAAGKVNKDHEMAIPVGVNVPATHARDVGTEVATSKWDMYDLAQIYVVNRDRCPKDEHKVVFGALRMEIAKNGWVAGQADIVPVGNLDPLACLVEMVNDLETVKDKIGDIRTLAWMLPLNAEYVFRTTGHHFLTTDAGGYQAKYLAVFRSALVPHLAGLLPPALLFHTVAHWVGPAREWEVLTAQAESSNVPDGLKIRMRTGASGTAIVTTTQAIIDVMGATGVEVGRAGGFDLAFLGRVAEAIKVNPIAYHKAYFAYRIPQLSIPARDEFERAKLIAIQFAPIAQGFVDAYLSGADLSKAKALAKHAQGNPVLYRRCLKYFRAVGKREVGNIADLFTDQLERGDTV